MVSRPFPVSYFDFDVEAARTPRATHRQLAGLNHCPPARIVASSRGRWAGLLEPTAKPVCSASCAKKRPLMRIVPGLLGAYVVVGVEAVLVPVNVENPGTTTSRGTSTENQSTMSAPLMMRSGTARSPGSKSVFQSDLLRLVL